MYIVKNALQNLLRNIGRNLMMGGIIFVIIVSVVTALMINNTADGVINDYKARFSSEVSFSPNMGRMSEGMQTGGSRGVVSFMRPVIPPEDLLRFADSEYLKESVFTAQTRGNSEQLSPIDGELGGMGSGPMVSGPMAGGSGGAAIPQGQEYYHKVLGDNYADFKEGLRELTEDSRFPKNENECIISQELLENSGLMIGDVITVTSALNEPPNESGEMIYTDISWEFTIVGTYLDATDSYSEGMFQNAFTNRRNEIITTFWALADKMEDGKHGIDVEAKYYLKSPDLLDAFAEEVYAKGLDPNLDVVTDSASYERVVGPVEGLKGISITFVIIVLAFGGIILALLASIAIRERKYEIGVLRAMGMKKSKVVAGLWTETLVITMICLVIGLAAGALAAQPVTDVMLDRQVAAAEASNSFPGVPPGAMVVGNAPVRGSAGAAMPISVGRPGFSNAQPLKDLDVSLNFLTILEIVGIALLLSSLSGIISTRKITKYEPIKILMER